MAYEIENAKIDYTHLGTPCSDHGIQSFCIGLDYGGGGQGFGMICMDSYDEAIDKRVPTVLASGLLLAINELWGANWEDLIGRSCRSYHTSGHIFALGHYLKDKWLWYDEATENFKTGKFKEMEAACRSKK